MSDLTIGRESAGTAARSASDLYRAVWRWHFYAGLLVLPFLIIARDNRCALPVPRRNRRRRPCRPQARRGAGKRARVAPSAMVAAALKSHPGTAVKFTDPASPAASAEVTISTETAGKLAVYVNPYDGQVLGSLPDRGTIMWTIRYLHSLKYFGSFARCADRDRRRLVHPARRHRHLSLVAAQADGRRRYRARHAEAPGLLARHPCRHRHLRRLLHRLPGDHRHALVRHLGREDQ